MKPLALCVGKVKQTGESQKTCQERNTLVQGYATRKKKTIDESKAEIGFRPLAVVCRCTSTINMAHGQSTGSSGDGYWYPASVERRACTDGGY